MDNVYSMYTFQAKTSLKACTFFKILIVTLSMLCCYSNIDDYDNDDDDDVDDDDDDDDDNDDDDDFDV